MGPMLGLIHLGYIYIYIDIDIYLHVLSSAELWNENEEGRSQVES